MLNHKLVTPSMANRSNRVHGLIKVAVYLLGVITKENLYDITAAIIYRFYLVL